MLFIVQIRTEGDKLFSFDEQPVKSNVIVQSYYAFTAARGGEMRSCGDEAHESQDTCVADEDCEWSEIQERCNDFDPCPRPAPKPRSSPIISDQGRPAWVSIIYEAPDGGNLLDDDRMMYMQRFEDRMLTTANGATNSGAASPWREDWCLKTYPMGSDEGKCGPVSSIISMLSMTSEGRAVVAEQVEAGYSPFGTLGSCFCSDEDRLCEVCSESGEAVDITSWSVSTRACAMAALGAAQTGPTPSDSETSAQCSAGMGGASMSGGVESMFADFCAGLPSCQWAPPGASALCSSSGFNHATDIEGGLVQGAEKAAVLEKMCDETKSGWWNMRKQALPQGFDCEGLATHGGTTRFARTTFFAGNEDVSNTAAYDEFAEGYVQGMTGWYQSIRQLEMEIETDSEGKVRIIVYSGVTLRAQFLEILFIDALLSTGSMVFVWLYMWWTLESCLLASCAMFEIIFSIPVAMCLWTLVLRQKIIFNQVLVVYMILGIGADDAFILYDAWQQARLERRDVTQHWTTRFAYAYRRSFSAMAVTTATTCGSFVVGACSPLPAVRDFCVFAAVVVLVDWLFCISFFASSVIVFERFFKSERAPGECLGPGCCFGCCRFVGKNLCGRRAAVVAPGMPPKKRGMEQWCEGPLFDFLERRKKPLIGFWVTVILALGISAAVQLRTATKRNPIGREDLDVVRGFDILLDEFAIFGTPTVSFVYGIDADAPMEKWADANVPRYTDGVGALVTAEGQLELLQVCRAADLGNDEDSTRCDGRTCLVLGRGLDGKCPLNEAMWKSTGFSMPDDMMCQGGSYCFMEQLAEFWAYSQGGCNTASQAECDTAGCAWATLSGSNGVCHSTTRAADYPGLPEEEFLELLTGAEFLAYQDARKMALLASGRSYEAELSDYLTGYKLDGSGALSVAWVSFNASIPRENTANEANEWYDRWEAFRLRHGSTIGGFQTTEVYLFMVTQNEMVKAAVLGIVLSLAVSFVVLVLTTRNWWVASLGLVNIGGISIAVLGVMPFLGWALGESECIFLIAVVGLSVDYSVHLLHSYNHGTGETREDRSRQALAEMGISVTNSAITTLLAAIILFGCGFFFFFQFGAFIFFVIGFSIVMSIFFLIPLLLVMGPKGNQGNFEFPCRKKTAAASMEPAEKKS